MKPICCSLILTVACLFAGISADAQAHQSSIDSSRIQRMDNGEILKKYFFVMLTKGSRRDEIKDTARINALQRGHMENMDRMAKAGKLVVAGPFGDNGAWRGIFIFDCNTEAEVRQLLTTDPAISAGRLDYEIHPWWTQQGTVIK